MASLVSLHAGFTLLLGVFLSSKLNSAQPYCGYKQGRKFPNTHGCTYLEHCSGAYNHQTGVCTNQCEKGWMGPRCQYVNLAINGLNNDTVFDGNIATHRKLPDAKARVNLAGNFTVSALIILREYQYGDSTISVQDRHNNICFNGSLSTTESTVYFSRPFLTDVLLINFGRMEDIKEIEVFGGKNVALWKSTSQTSTYTENYVHFTSDRAVDGSGTRMFSRNSCTHTNPGEMNPRWTLQLGKPYVLIAIIIKNRNDNQHRIDGFKLHAVTSQGRNISFFTDLNPSNLSRDSILIDSSSMPTTSVTEITIVGGNRIDRILTLCEVYVFACRPVHGDENCISFCPENCKTGSICNNARNFKCPACRGGWTGPYCKQAIQCQKPTNLPLNLQVLHERSIYQYQERIIFTCAEGFSLIGDATLQCIQPTDFQQNLPTCSAIQCQKPTTLTPHLQVRLEKSYYDYKERIYFMCGEGFSLIGDASLQCIQPTDFQQHLPTCLAIQCQKPTNLPSNLEILAEKNIYFYRDIIKFSCAEGFNLQGNATKTCIQSIDFLQPLPTCSAITCGRPTVQNPLHIHRDTDRKIYHYKQHITFFCSAGFNIQGPVLKFCEHTRDFEQNLPNCTAVQCKSMSLKSDHMSIDPPKGYYDYNTTVSFSCNEGYNLEGPSNAVCGNNNTFSFNTEGVPRCKAVQCRLPSLKQKEVMIHRDKNITIFGYNSTVLFHCLKGFKLKGSRLGVCSQNNSFLLAEGYPICEAVSDEANSQTAPIAGGIVGGLFAALVLIVIAVVIIRRQRREKNSNSEVNGDISLDKIDHQYAEVNTRRNKGNQYGGQDKVTAQERTYYNLNDADPLKAKLARQEVYYEFSPTSAPTQTAVSVSELKNYVERKRREDGFFAEQFKKFYTGLQFPATAAVMPGNRSKNKYRNIYPYDETRVLLKSGRGQSDFINASFINGYGNLKSYIAAQGPLINTIDDFWLMIWNERCLKIVMLTNLIEDDKVKCIQYWPDKDKMKTGDMVLEVVDIESFADFTIRTFSLENNKEKRIIRQFHFTAWPDKGVPLYASSLVHFHSKVIHTGDQGKGPLVVHCSAGIGRTGTFIALDILTHQAKESSFVDVFGCVETLRRQRVNMVQTSEQYVFVHDTLIEALMCTSSDPSTAEFPKIYQDLLTIDPDSKKRNIDLYFEDIGAALSLPPESAYSLAKDADNKSKNRYSNILPVDTEMPQLKDGDNKLVYINAVFLPGYKTKRSFIVTQIPLKQTVDDFWRLLFDQKVSTVVMLNDSEMEKSTGKQNIGIYWPDHEKTHVFGTYHITTQNQEEEEKDFTVIDLLCYQQEEENETEARTIRVYKCNFWPDCKTVPNSVLKFLKLINAVELHNDRNNTGPVVVQCMNGAEKSGLFCVLQVVLERMKIEQDVAIHQVIQQMRSVRPSIIPNVEQLKFCYDAVMEFLNQFDAYSNFQ